MIDVSFFGVLATASLAFALAIPFSFEKLFRQGYEEKVAKYKENLFNDFKGRMSSAVNKLQSTKELTDDLIQNVDELVENWNSVKDKSSKLDLIAQWGKNFLLVFMIPFVLNSITIIFYQWPNSIWLVLLTFVSIYVFMSCFIGVVVYIIILLLFDKELAKVNVVKERIEQKDFRLATPSDMTSGISQERSAELNIINRLKDEKINFETEVRDKDIRSDIVINGINKPKFFIEIKFFYRPTSVIFLSDRIISRFAFIKQKYPNSKTILIMNHTKETSLLFKERLRVFVDKIFDFNEIDEFIKFIKNN